MRHTWVMLMLLGSAAFVAGCVEQLTVKGGTIIVSPGSGGGFDPNKQPRLIGCTPNAGPEGSPSEFYIDAANLKPDTDVEITFGSNQWTGRTNDTGSRILNPAHPLGKFTAPGGTGSVDLDIFVDGQNPPFLSKALAFTYLPPGTPALPTVLTMQPNTSDEHGGQVMVMTGTNAPMSAGYLIVATFLFSSVELNTACTQTADDTWEVTIPAVPATENYTTGDMDVTVRITFSDPNTPQLLPIAITDAAPVNLIDGNPLKYTHSGTPLSPQPQEYVIMSGLANVGAAGASRAAESYVRTIERYDPASDTRTPYAGLQSRYMYNGSTVFAPAGTHHYPSPIQNSTPSFREANSTFAHIALPQFIRQYEPAVPLGVPQPPAVEKFVTGKLFHATGQESGTSGPTTTGIQDTFFAAYSNGQAERFDVGDQSVHEEIHVHQNFTQFPYFAVVHDNPTPRIVVARCDGRLWASSGENTSDLILTNVTGEVKHLSLKFAGKFLFFATTDGNVWRCDVEAAAPQATAMNWPAGVNHSYVSDEFALSGDGTTICFVAGDGNVRFDTPTQTGYSTHEVFAIVAANQGNSNIIAVTDFVTAGGARQIMSWDIGGNATYGTNNVDNGSNDRRIYMAGVNAHSNQTNLPGADIVVNYDGQICAFITREDRNVAEGPQTPFVVYYLYVARIGQGTNKMYRINSTTGNNFGIGNVFDHNMTVIPGIWFPRVVPNSGMRNRLVFSVAGLSGAGVTGQSQHLFTADIPLTSNGISTPIVHNRVRPGTPTPYEINAQTPTRNFFGAFQSRGGHTLFLIDADTADLLYLDLRDGVTTGVEPVVRAHDNAPIKLPRYDAPAAPQNQNTYLPPGFSPEPLSAGGRVNLEHWANQLHSLHGPGLTASTSEYLLFVAEELPEEEDVYVLQMSSLTSSLPSPAINVSNIPGPGVIKVVTPALDGSVMALVKGQTGFTDGYRFAGAAGSRLYVVNDFVAAMNANESSLTLSAEHIPLAGNRISRSMGWYQDPSRYTLYFGEGSTTFGGSPATSKSFLRFTRLDLDRSSGNTIGTPTQITSIAGTVPLTEGAIYIYSVGKQE